MTRFYDLLHKGARIAESLGPLRESIPTTQFPYAASSQAMTVLLTSTLFGLYTCACSQRRTFVLVIMRLTFAYYGALSDVTGCR